MESEELSGEDTDEVEEIEEPSKAPGASDLDFFFSVISDMQSIKIPQERKAFKAQPVLTSLD